MGYDEHLFSLKSKIFVLSIHSEIRIKASIKDAVGTNMDERARDLLLNNEVTLNGAGNGASSSNDCVIVVVSHNNAGARTIGAINKLDVPIKVSIDMSQSVKVHMTPTNGKVTKIIPPHEIRYMSSIVIEPDTAGASFHYKFTSTELNNSKINDENLDNE